MISVAEARSRFDPVPGYLNAASLGLPTEPRPLGERIRQISAWFFGSPQEAGDWSLLFVELWPLAMRESGLRPRMRQIHDWSRRPVAAMTDQQAKKLGIALIGPAGDLADAVLARGNGLMQHLPAPSERTAQTYRSALHAMFRAAARSSGEGGCHDNHRP